MNRTQLDSSRIEEGSKVSQIRRPYFEQPSEESRSQRPRVYFPFISDSEDPLDGRRKQDAATETTFKAIAEDYLAREGKHLRSIDQRREVFERLIYPELGTKQTGDIKRSDILDKIEDERGPRMAHMTLAYISKLMNWHAARDDGFRTPIVRGMGRVKPKERERDRILTDDELRAVWKVAEASGSPFARLVQFILLTAARRTEASAMLWTELDGEWTLPAACNKTEVDLVRPLSAEARAVLPAKVDGCPFVFTTDGMKPISAFSTFKLALDKTCGVTGWTLHDLRRTTRSLMSRAGVQSAALATSSAASAVFTIATSTWPKRRDAFDRLAALINRIVA